MTLQNRKIQFYSSHNVATIYIINEKCKLSPIKTEEGTELQQNNTSGVQNLYHTTIFCP
jgi:hypothetical protein